MSVRDDIAAAANTVTGISASPYFRAATGAGAAYVRLDRVEYPNPFGGIAYWDLMVLLPQDYAAAEKFAEAMIPDLVDALSEVLAVDRARPEQLQITGVGTIPVIAISGHREAVE